MTARSTAENLIAERIIHEIIPFGGSVTVRASYDTAGLVGEHTIIVKADGIRCHQGAG